MLRVEPGERVEFQVRFRLEAAAGIELVLAGGSLRARGAEIRAVRAEGEGAGDGLVSIRPETESRDEWQVCVARFEGAHPSSPAPTTIEFWGELLAPQTAGVIRVEVLGLVGNMAPEPGRVASLDAVVARDLLVLVGSGDLPPEPGWQANRGAERAALQPLPGEPVRGLTPAQREAFETGRLEFERELQAPDGLGPSFNDQSCAICHLNPSTGGFSERENVRFGLSGPPFDALVERGGSVLQAQGINPACIELLPAESDVQAIRITPHLFGSGLVEAVADGVLLALSEAQPEAVRGRPHRTVPIEGGDERVGRFGWKSQLPTLLSFTANASLQEMGMTSRWLPGDVAPNGNQALLDRFDRVQDPEQPVGEDGRDRLDLLVDFQRWLAPPPQSPPSGLRGEALFGEVGCAMCHTPELRASASAAPPLADRVLRPYSDFLLHDIGPAADGIPQGAAGPSFMRTAPLWGMAGRKFLWHDGSLRGAPLSELLVLAIERHGGQAVEAVEAFRRLSQGGRADLIRFLLSLGRPPFDLDGDGGVGEADRQAMAVVLAGRGPIGPDDLGGPADLDASGRVDPAELAIFQEALARRAPPRLGPR